jgi:hypothetical protein
MNQRALLNAVHFLETGGANLESEKRAVNTL